MPARHDPSRKPLPASLASLAGLACAACCAIPLLLTGGALSGAAWAAADAWLPGVALALAVLAGATWWRVRRHRRREMMP